MFKIPVDEYLYYSLILNEKEKEMRSLFNQKLPEKIFDSHAHSNTIDHFINMPVKFFKHPVSTFPYFSLESSSRAQKLFFNDRKVYTLRSPLPISGINHEEANNYLYEHVDDFNLLAFYGIPTNIDYTVEKIGSLNVLALKMYQGFFVNKEVCSIYDFFPKSVLEVAQSKNIPIILHLHKCLEKSLDDLRDLFKNFPKLRVILAHMGIPSFENNLDIVYNKLSIYDNLFFDTAMVTSEKIIASALREVGHRRILFGSDQPLNLIRANMYYCKDEGKYYVVDYNYHWVDKKKNKLLKNNFQFFTHVHWHIIEAVIKAIESVYIKKEQKKVILSVFFENAYSLFIA